MTLGTNMFGFPRLVIVLGTVWISLSEAGLPPPTRLTAEWVNPMTVNVSWTRPEGLPQGCNVEYVVRRNGEPFWRFGQTQLLDLLLSENASKCVYGVQTVSSCTEGSSEVETVVYFSKPQVVLRDFKCVLLESAMNCSWIKDPSSSVSLYYSDCQTTAKPLFTGFSKCPLVSDAGPRAVCHLNGSYIQRDLCMVAVTPNRVRTFRAPKVFALPKMNIYEEGTDLVLTFSPPALKTPCSVYNISYSVCNQPWKHKEYSTECGSLKIPYNKNCQYKFQYKTQIDKYCADIGVAWSGIIVYGSSDWTLTVVYIVVPILVSACVILSCICFRRHQDVLFPEVPDPSAMFKEMMSSSRGVTTEPSLYTPARESVDQVLLVPHSPHSPGPVLM